MSFLTLTSIQKSFGPVQVVKDFNMSIEKGEFISFLGPSGCGKTTILRMIAGFETPSGGTIQIGGKTQDNLKPNQRNIGMVFQAYALFPNMTVFDNVAFGLKVAGKPKAEIEARALYQEAAKHCRDVGDFPSEDLFKALMKDEEGHIDFLETQLDLIARIGLELYTQKHIGGLEGDDHDH